MWRQNAHMGNSDSDQSISDEEFNGDLGDDFVSLNSNRRKQQQGLLLQRLEMLGDANNATSSYENKSSLFVEDEVEMPDFPNEDGLILSQRKESASHPDEDIISEEDDYPLLNYSIISGARILNTDNNLNNFRNEKRAEACSWSMINKEAEALIHLSENALPSDSLSKENKSCKGITGKVKPKFSLRPISCKDEGSLCCISADENFESFKVDYVQKELETIDEGSTEKANSEFSEDLNTKNENIFPAKVEASTARLMQNPMAELLDGLQDRNASMEGNHKAFRRVTGKKPQLVLNRSRSPAGDAIVDSEDQTELVYPRLSCGDEMKKQTMADRFQEAFAATSFSNAGGVVIAAKLSSVGLFGKLQHLMQSEKERDVDFLTKRQMGAGCNDKPPIVVKILSRYLEAKLIVCQCSVGKHTEGFQFSEISQTLLDRRMSRTIIFNTKVCSDVDLEVGHLICLHPPWKEVEMTDTHESIILCTYFSHIMG